MNKPPDTGWVRLAWAWHGRWDVRCRIAIVLYALSRLADRIADRIDTPRRHTAFDREWGVGFLAFWADGDR